MAVNTMSFEQASSLLAAIQSQVTGVQTSAPLNTADFISVAQKTLQNGYEPVMAAISQVIGRTLIAVRPYSRKFGGLEVSSERWGGIVRKISFTDKALSSTDDTYSLTDGAAIDQYKVNKPGVIETRYVGQVVYQGSYTIFTKQLDVAFSSPAEFGAFMSGLMTHFSNEREQWLEDLSRAIMANMITAKALIQSNDATTMHVVHALTRYNSETGLNLTATTVRQPDNFPAFCKWLYASVEHLSDMMTERSRMFQMSLTGATINRHTPKADQKVYLNSDFLAHMTAEVLADTYHDTFLKFADVESVNFWQAFMDPMTVEAKPVYIDATGAVVTGDDTTVNNVIGVIFDRDAAGYNIGDSTLETSPYNAAGQYYNLFSHVRAQLQNDFTEKAVVICLD